LFYKGPQQVVDVPVPDDLDATLRGTEVDDKLAEAEEPGPSPFDPEQLTYPTVSPETAQPETRRGKRGMPRAQPTASPLSPRRTRARAHLQTANLYGAGGAASQILPSAKTKASVLDEFVAHSDDDSDMHEVEANLQVSTASRGTLRITSGYFYPSVLTLRCDRRATGRDSSTSTGYNTQ
jgi:hypothetical protein